MRCDIIIPVYSTPEWIIPCVKLAIKYTPVDFLHQIILIDDSSHAYTQQLLYEVAASDTRIRVYKNEKKGGVIQTINRDSTIITSPYILLLNSGCFLTPNAIPKLIAHAQKEKNVGLISPISNNSPMVTFEMLPGYSFLEMNALLEKLFAGVSVDACTIVGNCLLITRECFESVAIFDECYGRNCSEETDYQFKALEKGFEARIALDTYVYHKAEANFGSRPDAEEHRKHNHALFMQRWGGEYQKRFSFYQEHNPVTIIAQKTQEYFQKSLFIPITDVLIYLPMISQKVGGVHNVIDIVNELILNDIKVVLITSSIMPFYEMMLTQPVFLTEDEFINNCQIQAKAAVATAWDTVYGCYYFAKKNNIPLVYFVQGYEVFFENGINYHIVRETYQLADAIITISQWLSHNLLTRFDIRSQIFPNGYHQHVFYSDGYQLLNNPPIITMVLRGSEVKGDWILQDIIQLLLKEYGERIQLYVIVFEAKEWSITSNSNVRVIKAPLSRQQIADNFRKTSIFIDASLHEGFGLFPLEAMACGAVVVASDSGGIREFVHDGVNGFLISAMNKPEKYVEKIRALLEDRSRYLQFRMQALRTVSAYHSETTLQQYAQFFSNIHAIPIKPKDQDCPLNKAYRGQYYVSHQEDFQASRKIFSQCFVGQQLVFSEEYSMTQTITGKEKYLEFDLTPYQHIQAIRFDPLNDAVALKLSSIKIITQEGNEHFLSAYVSNAYFRSDQCLIFTTRDPQIYCSVPFIQRPQTLMIELEFIAVGQDVWNYLPPYFWLRWKYVTERYRFCAFKIRQWFSVRSASHEN